MITPLEVGHFMKQDGLSFFGSSPLFYVLRQ